MYYLLDENKKPYKVSLEEGMKVYEDLQMKIVEQDVSDNGKIFISTVFLGMDHSFDRHNKSINHKPILFETMIFGGEHNDFQARYHTYDEAIEGHQYALNLVEESLNPKKEK